MFLANEKAKDQIAKTFKDLSQEEKRDKMEKEIKTPDNNLSDQYDQVPLSTNPDSINDPSKNVNESEIENPNNPMEMEGALKRLSLTENIKVKTEINETPIISAKSLEQNKSPVVTPSPPVITPLPPVVTPSPPVVTPSPPVVTPSPPVVTPSPPVVTSTPMITPVRISELKITQVHQNVQQPHPPPLVFPNKPSEIRISQVRGSLPANVMPRPHLIPQRRTSDPPLLHLTARSSVPRISNVTSLHRSQVWDSPPPMQGHLVHAIPRLPLPNPSRSYLFEESKRFKYREGL